MEVKPSPWRDFQSRELAILTTEHFNYARQEYADKAAMVFILGVRTR